MLHAPCSLTTALFLPILVLLVASPLLPAHAAPVARLVVVISVDQLRNDRLTEDFPGGLGRLVRDGRRFPVSSVAHAITETCPGHAVIMTGMHPAGAGIPGNTYIERGNWRRRYCVDDDEPTHEVLGGTGSRSPWMLRASGLGEWIRTAGVDSRVHALAGKDRAAIMLGGLRADGVLWFAPELGAFTSSRYYTQALPEYVIAFNTGLLSRLPATWEHGPGHFRGDDFPGESKDNSRVSGHPLAAGKAAGRQIQQSPFVDELTLALAMQVVAEEQLGSGDGIDVLALSLSANDTVGHLYGPFSAEVDDTLARLDRELARFLDFLDSRIGVGRYVVALTADHGVTALPEYTLARGASQCPVAGGRISHLDVAVRVYGRIYWRFTGPFHWPTSLVRIAGSQVYLNDDYMTAKGLDPEAVRSGVKAILEAVPGVRKAWTRSEIVSDVSEAARLLRHSLVPDRSGDLVVQLYPDCVLGSEGTSHGMFYPSDRFVPVLFFGAGVVPGQDWRPARSVDVAPSLAHLLGIPVPATLDGAVLDLAREPAAKP